MKKADAMCLRHWAEVNDRQVALVSEIREYTAIQPVQPSSIGFRAMHSLSYSSRPVFAAPGRKAAKCPNCRLSLKWIAEAECDRAL